MVYILPCVSNFGPWPKAIPGVAGPNRDWERREHWTEIIHLASGVMITSCFADNLRESTTRAKFVIAELCADTADYRQRLADSIA